MDTPYNTARDWGRQAARDSIAKKKPKSLGDLGKLLQTLEKHVEKKYAPYAKSWKIAYLGGVEEELTNCFTKLSRERRK